MKNFISTNVSVLQDADIPSIEALIIKNQLRWSGHVVRMPDERLPKQIFYSQLREGSRKRGGQKKRYKDTLKANLKKCSINVSTWESDAKEKDFWRSTTYDAAELFESRRREELEEKRRTRKERQQQPRNDPSLPSGATCPQCQRTFKARIGLIGHLRVHKRNN